MILSLIIGFVAISISAVAAYYSIVGLAAIFAAAAIPIIIMGIVLEIGKVSGVVWLHLNWKRAPFLSKAYLVPGVMSLMFLTSMGIYGFLSKAHIDQNISTGDNLVMIQQFDNRISRENARIKNAESVLTQLDSSVDVLIKYDRIRGPTGAIVQREKQKDERAQLAQVMSDAQDTISVLLEKQALLKAEQNKFEADIGPVKYIAALIYGDSASKNQLEKAVRWVIIIIVMVFDPLAIILILSAVESWQWAKNDRHKRKDDTVADSDFIKELEDALEEKRVELAKAQELSNKLMDRNNDNDKTIEEDLQTIMKQAQRITELENQINLKEAEMEEIQKVISKPSPIEVVPPNILNELERKNKEIETAKKVSQIDSQDKDRLAARIEDLTTNNPLNVELANMTLERDQSQAKLKEIGKDLAIVQSEVDKVPVLETALGFEKSKVAVLEQKINELKTTLINTVSDESLLQEIEVLKFKLQQMTDAADFTLDDAIKLQELEKSNEEMSLKLASILTERSNMKG